MDTKPNKLKTIIKWYDILLRRGIVKEGHYKQVMYAILHVDEKTLDGIYQMALDKLEEHKDDWVKEDDLL